MPPPSHVSGARPRRRPLGSSARPRLLLGLLVVVAFVALLDFSDFEWREAPAMLQRVNRPLALVLMATLPVIGFPISAVYLAAGALFGPWWGGAAVAGATFVHVLATHALARTILRPRLARWHRRLIHRVPRVPPEEKATLVAMIVVVPALPYLARNILLVLSEAPLRYLFGVGVPLYVARSCVTIFLGDLGNDPSRRALLILGAVFVTKLAVSALLFERLRRRSRPPA